MWYTVKELLAQAIWNLSCEGDRFFFYVINKSVAVINQ